MKVTRTLTTLSAVSALGLALSGPVAAAEDDHGFAMLKGVEAKSMSAQDMQAVSGELNALDIAASLAATAVKLDKLPRLQTAVENLSARVAADAAQINALFMKFHVYTPPK